MTAPAHSLLADWHAADRRLIEAMVEALARLPEAEHATWLAGLLKAMETAGLPGTEQTMDALSEMIAWRMVKGEW